MDDYIIPRSIPWGNTHKPIKIVLEGQEPSCKLLNSRKKTIEFNINDISTDGKTLTVNVEAGKPIKILLENEGKTIFQSGSFDDIIDFLKLSSSEIQIDGYNCKIVSTSPEYDVKMCEEGTPISEREAWNIIMTRISQIQ